MLYSSLGPARDCGGTRMTVLHLGYLSTQNLGLSSKEMIKGMEGLEVIDRCEKIKGVKSRKLTE